MTDGRTQPGGLVDGRFLLKHQLGGGGAATVWAATDLHHNRDVALKLLHPRYRGIAEAHERLAREASLLASFTHPHIARAQAFELDRAQPYFVMTLIQGESLEDELAARSTVDDFFGWGELLRVVGQICSAVDYAHAHEVVHRDLKPSNIMLDSTTAPPDVRVLDFGIAKLLGGVSQHPTTQGRVMGTGFYMAPEQARGDPLDRRADLFSLGVVVFEMVTLRRAWVRSDRGGPVRAFAEAARRNEFNTPSAILSRIARETRPRASDFRPGLSAALDSAITWALAIEPDDRPPSAKAFFDELAAAVAAVELDDHEAATVAAMAGKGDARLPVSSTWARSGVGAAALAVFERSDGASMPSPMASDRRVQAEMVDNKPTPLGASPPPTEDAPDADLPWDDVGTVVNETPSEGRLPRLSDEPPDEPLDKTRTVSDPAESLAADLTLVPPMNSTEVPRRGAASLGTSRSANEAGGRGSSRKAGPAATGSSPIVHSAPGRTPKPTFVDPSALGAPQMRTASVLSLSPMLPTPWSDGTQLLKVAVIAVSLLTAGALLLLAGYQLGRQTAPRAPAPEILSSEPARDPRPEVVPVPDMEERAVPRAEESAFGAKRTDRTDRSDRTDRTDRTDGHRATGDEPDLLEPRPKSAEPEARRRRRRRRTAAAVPEKPERPLAELHRMMREARSRPEDLALLTRLGKAIEARAGDIKNRSERARVRRIARSSAMLGDADGLDEALKALSAALN